MRILIISSFNKGRFAPFITEQVDGQRRMGVECEYFGVIGRGLRGYLSNLPRLRKMIKDYRPDLIHAHYGLCGLLANLQRNVPVITTYHGSDINDSKILPLSKISIRLSAHNIFVSRKCVDKAGVESRYSIIPCGVDLSLFREISFSEARSRLGWDEDSVKILFAGAFDDPMKDCALARRAVSLINGAELVELKGYTRSEVPILMSACNVLLMTSVSEGSPQVIKEALACGCPIVSVDVGDVREMVEDVPGCYISDRKSEDIADVLMKVMTDGRIGRCPTERLESLSSENVVRKIYSIYDMISRHS